MSANYLSTLLLQVADLKTTKYNDYLSALYRYVPVIDSNGYITADDEYYTFDETSEYTDLLAGYEKVQYNNLFDTIGTAMMSCSTYRTIPHSSKRTGKSDKIKHT